LKSNFGKKKNLKSILFFNLYYFEKPYPA
jgi:hypothetical protein